jgi:hypothetical protein
MPSQQAATPVERQAKFDNFYAELAPVLIDFIDVLGIEPAQEVLKQAGDYLPYVEKALADMAIADDDDRLWLQVRMMYYIGEYFAQQYGGYWFVNETPGSPMFGRCVVGKFSRFPNASIMVDPFEIASAYVDLPCPRLLADLVAEVEMRLAGSGGPGLH